VFFFKLLIKHAPLLWVILHAVGIQLGSISGDTVAIITRCRQSLCHHKGVLVLHTVSFFVSILSDFHFFLISWRGGGAGGGDGQMPALRQ